MRSNEAKTLILEKDSEGLLATMSVGDQAFALFKR